MRAPLSSFERTGSPVARLRFRIVDITTFPPAGGVADLRVRTSPDYTATCVGTGGGCTTPGAIVDVRGTTLEQPPLQPFGGGFNSSLSAGAITLSNQLPNGASINVQLLRGVQQNGAFRFFVNVEALPEPAVSVAPATKARAMGRRGIAKGNN